MGTFRLYAGADQQAHIETIDLKAKSDWLKGLAASQISFREWPAGQFLDWHPAPRRQFVITLTGRGEIEVAGGQKVAVGPGHINLIEDTTGKGHITRNFGSIACATAFAMPSDFCVPGTPKLRKKPSQSSTLIAAAPLSKSAASASPVAGAETPEDLAPDKVAPAVTPSPTIAHATSGQPDRTLMKRSTYVGVVDTGPMPGETYEQKIERLTKLAAAAKQRAEEGG